MKNRRKNRSKCSLKIVFNQEVQLMDRITKFKDVNSIDSELDHGLIETK